MLLPPSLDDWLPEGPLARFRSEGMSELDLRPVYESYEKDGRGQAAYDPLRMRKVLFYGYCTGTVASRKIEKESYENVAFRYLSANEHPDPSTLAEFRRRHWWARAALFVEVWKRCRKAGLVKRGHVALDGTKSKANASRYRNASYEHLSEQEKQLAGQVEPMLAEAEQADGADDPKYGRTRRGEELPAALARRETRLQKIRAARAELERQARQEAEQKKAAAEQRLRERQEKAAAAGRPWRGKRPRIPDPAPAKPHPKDSGNLTDAESRIRLDKTSGGFLQAYHAQVAVDSHSPILVAADLTPQQNDRAQRAPRREQVKQNTGAPPEKGSADTDYDSPPQVPAPILDGMALYVKPEDPPKSHETKIASRAGPPRRQPPRSGYGPDGIPRIDPWRAKLATPEGRAIYAKRREIVEPVFGQIKQGRSFRQFLLRGLAQTRAEGRLICLTHNLLQLYRSGGTPQPI